MKAQMTTQKAAWAVLFCLMLVMLIVVNTRNADASMSIQAATATPIASPTLTPSPTPTREVSTNNTGASAPSLVATPSPTPTAGLPSLEKVKVVDAYKLGAAASAKKERNSAGIGDIIVVKVSGLQDLMNVEKCQSSDHRTVQNCQPQQIALYLDGREMQGIRPEARGPLADDETLQFHLQRNLDSDETWADLLGAPRRSTNLWRRQTRVSVGFAGAYALSSIIKGNAEEGGFELVRVHRSWAIGATFVLVIVALFMLWAAVKSNMIRDAGPNPPGNKLKPYSLGRTQMAFWFILILFSFVYIWLITGGTVITPTTLGLMGIGAAGALGAAAIDVSKGKSSATPAVSVNIVNDLLTDENGYTFHRFQMLVWTLILGFIFIYGVWKRLSMPDFDPILLALLGLSSGTYLGFKFREDEPSDRVASDGAQVATAPANPKVDHIDPSSLPKADEPKKVTIHGANLNSVKSAKFVLGNDQILCNNPKVMGQTVTCDVSTAKANAGSIWKLAIITTDDTEIPTEIQLTVTES